jgi:small acid-soluble spore protein A (major alpha-type SASP)
MARQREEAADVLVPDARDALERFKYETARAIGLGVRPHDDWGDIPSRQCGAVGGEMVRRMIRMAEEDLAGQTGATRRRR